MAEMGSKKNPISEKLEAFKSYYGTLEGIVSELQKYPGFEKLNRATVSRWLKEPTGRAELAVKILSKNTGGSQVRIALPRTVWGFAISYALTQKNVSAPHSSTPHTEMFSIIAPQIIFCDSDEQSLEHLELGSVDLCFCPESISHVPHIKPFFHVASLPLIGLLSKPITSTKQLLHNNRFAFCAGSYLFVALQKTFFHHSVPFHDIAPQTNDNICEQFQDGTLQGIVGFEPTLSHLQKQLKAYNVDNVIRDLDHLGHVDIVLMINTEDTDLTHLLPVSQYIYSRLKQLESEKATPYLVQYINQNTELPYRIIEEELEKSFFGVHSLQTQTFFENILSQNDVWEKRDQSIAKAESFEPANIDEFYKYYSEQIANSKSEVWITSDGFNMKNPVSKKYSEIIGKSFKSALTNGVQVYRYQILETMHINWIDTLILVKKQFPNLFHIYINESLDQIPNICSIDPESEQCVSERMEHVTGLLGQGSQAESFVFRHGDKTAALKNKKLIENIIQHPKTQEMTVNSLKALKASLFKQRVDQLHQWQARNNQGEAISLQASGIFDEHVLNQFLGKQKD